ncbi:hypothetical protein [Streptomyces sp. NPDC058086]|uniref:hypothetical protein n=1 Tax=Streptomyces sp. NPDC058086 TaxID=3346334 RepID=UPI0036ECFDBD
MGSLPAHMERIRTHPGIAGEVLRLEYPNAKPYGKKTLLEMFDPTKARDRACLEALERELGMPWALYRVRRLFLLSGDGGHRPVMRSTERATSAAPSNSPLGSSACPSGTASRSSATTCTGGPVPGFAPRRAAWPMAEDLFTTAPARVVDKQDRNFDTEWRARLAGATAQLPFA